MANLFTKIKEAFSSKEKLEALQIKPLVVAEDTNKNYNVKLYTIKVEKYNENDPKAFYTINEPYKYGDMCLIYEKGTENPKALYQYKINGWERI